MKCALFLILVASTITTSFAQGRTFTYQGKLTDNALAANGSYDFQFILLTGSPLTQVGPPLFRPATTVINGIFTVQLNFSTCPGNPFLRGSEMGLEIGVKGPVDRSYRILVPNQPITSSPYAIRSEASSSSDLAADSQKLGGVVAAQYVLTGDPRMTDARNPLAGSN